MQTANVNGVKLEYEVQGSGEPMLLIHGAAVAETFVPLMSEPSLGKFRLVRYHRRGYAGSEHPGKVTNFTEQAADAAALLRHLGITKAHVVGHSYGGLLALRLAVAEPALVHTLSVIEPPLLGSAFGQEFVHGPIARVVEVYRSGDKTKTAESFTEAVAGPNAKNVIATKLPPSALPQAIRDIDTLFAAEFPDMPTGLFTEAEAPGLRMPVLSIVGEKTESVFSKSHEVLMRTLPRVEELRVRGVSHFVQVEEPRIVAEGISRFVARHPI